MIEDYSQGLQFNESLSQAEKEMMSYITRDRIAYWLDENSMCDFNKNKANVLPYLQTEKEMNLREEAGYVMAESPINTGHGIDHHNRTREIATLIAVAQGFDYNDVQTLRYGSQLHDISKLVKRGGKGHDWDQTRDMSEKILKRSGIPGETIPEVIALIIEHDTDDPSHRGRLGNALYEADSVDLTYLPRCFQFAQAMNALKPGTYDMMDSCIHDYEKYQVNVSKPKTDLGKAMFEKGKAWALPALHKLRDVMGSNKISPHFDFLSLGWRENIQKAPEFLSETLSEYMRYAPRYEINLANVL